MKFRLFLQAFDNHLIYLAAQQFRLNLLQTNCTLTGIIALPTRIKKFCVLRSPHIDKDSREHFEIRLSKIFFDIETSSISNLDSLLKMEFPIGLHCSLKILEN